MDDVIQVDSRTKDVESCILTLSDSYNSQKILQRLQLNHTWHGTTATLTFSVSCAVISSVFVRVQKSSLVMSYIYMYTVKSQQSFCSCLGFEDACPT